MRKVGYLEKLINNLILKTMNEENPQSNKPQDSESAPSSHESKDSQGSQESQSGQEAQGSHQSQSSPNPQKSSTPQSGGSSPGKEFSFDLDDRTKNTMIWSAVWYAVALGIENVVQQMSYYFVGGTAGYFYRAYGGLMGTFHLGSLVTNLIWGAVIGAVVGFVLSKFYPQIQDIVKKHLKGKLDTMFKLLFYPSLVGAAFALLFGGMFAFAVGAMFVLVNIGGSVLGAFVYAKMLSGKIGKDYPSPVA